MCVGDDTAVFILTVDFRQLCHRNAVGRNEVMQDAPGADGGKLVAVTDKDDMGSGADGDEQVAGQSGIEHRDFVDNQHVAPQWP